MLVQVDKFIFPTYFIILDYEANKEVPIILGQSFLFIRNALIDAHQRKLALRVNKQEVKFNIFNLLKYPNEPEHYNTIKSFGQDYCKEEVIVELFCNNV